MTPTCKHCRVNPVKWAFGRGALACDRVRSGKSRWRNYCSRECAGEALARTPEGRAQRGQLGRKL